MARCALAAAGILIVLLALPSAAADLTVGACVLGLGTTWTAAGVDGPFVGAVVGLGSPGLYTSNGGFQAACNAGVAFVRVCALDAFCGEAFARSLP